MEKRVSIGIIVILIMVVLGVFGYFSFGNQEVKPDKKNIIPPGEINGEEPLNNQPEVPEIHTVKISSSGFSPGNLEINKGDIVIFLNEGPSQSWPASAIHPTHTVYPNSGISKCGTAEEINIFDACKGLKTSEAYSFTFNEIGTWNYHDHLMPSKTGKIIIN